MKAAAGRRERALPRVDERKAAELVARYQEGDPGALEALHACLVPAIRSAFRGHRTGELPVPITLQDLRQQSWIVLAELAARWQPQGSFVGYFFRSFPREIDRYIRQARRADRAVLALGVAEAEPAYELEDPIAAAQWTDELRELPAAERGVFLLRTVEHRDFATIAELMDLSRSSAHRLYLRARAHLADQFDATAAREGDAPMLRLVRSLHAGAGPDGSIPGRRWVMARTGLSRTEYESLMRRLRAAGALVDRGFRASGRLADASAAATLARLKTT